MLERWFYVAITVFDCLRCRFDPLNKLVEANSRQVHNVSDVETINPVIFPAVVDSKIRSLGYLKLFLGK
jgi:hypothetical protein